MRSGTLAASQLAPRATYLVGAGEPVPGTLSGFFFFLLNLILKSEEKTSCNNEVT